MDPMAFGFSGPAAARSVVPSSSADHVVVLDACG